MLFLKYILSHILSLLNYKLYYYIIYVTKLN
nr:MAG TPA: hypothetical protein [Caudoviricetes sp.]